MKRTLFTLMVSLGLGGGIISCSDRLLEPECQVPTSLSSAKAGSYWIYERTPLDSLGKPIAGAIPTLDSLVLVGRDAAVSYNGTSALLLEDYYSNDGGKSSTKDTAYWVVTPEALYVRNVGMQQVGCSCSFHEGTKWREYENCLSTQHTISDQSYEGDNLPSLVPDGKGGQKIVNTTTQHWVKNTFTMLGSENISVNGTGVETKKSLSLLRWTFSILEPSDAKFVNGKRSTTQQDERTVWINRDIGVVKEKALSSDDMINSSFKGLPHSFERRLLRYNILR